MTRAFSRAGTLQFPSLPKKDKNVVKNSNPFPVIPHTSMLLHVGEGFFDHQGRGLHSTPQTRWPRFPSVLQVRKQDPVKDLGKSQELGVSLKGLY